MSRDPRYDVLFEPVAIGPVTAPNRFYQVPHCSGMGYERPRTLNRMREVNAEGGWGVVCTEFCSIHPSAISNKQCTLWDDDDVAMLGQVKRGILDLIGAARPSIADPFLPRKIAEGRPESIRECIGCNVCIWANREGVPLRCTQNPTRGEEWRRGWHPEEIEHRHADETVLIVGAGPAGLEAAVSLGKRGYRVALAEAGTALGGRVNLESRLPGLAEWGRVRDYRVQQLHGLANVEVFLDSRLDAGQILEFGFQHIGIATGSLWRCDGQGRSAPRPIGNWQQRSTLAVETLMDGAEVVGPCVVYDDDHHYMGSVVAEELHRRGHPVTLVTSANELAPDGYGSLEQHRTQARCLELGIELVTGHRVTSVVDGAVELRCKFTGAVRSLDCNTFVPVTSREPQESLYLELRREPERVRAAGILSVTRFGDCAAPGPVVAATFAGHRFARELGTNVAPVARDRVVLRAGAH